MHVCLLKSCSTLSARCSTLLKRITPIQYCHSSSCASGSGPPVLMKSPCAKCTSPLSFSRSASNSFSDADDSTKQVSPEDSPVKEAVENSPLSSSSAAAYFVGGPKYFNEDLGFYFRAVRWAPHPSKAQTGGEDAFLATDYVLGVADGVGWWNSEADEPDRSSEGEGGAGGFGFEQKTSSYLSQSASQRYSETLMRAAFDYCEEEYFGQSNVPVRGLVDYAYDECQNIQRGSTTLLFAAIRGEFLDIYNLGDCSCMVVRNREVYYRSEDMVHGLNFPYQLGTGCRDRPADGTVTSVPIRFGDLVILGTDGVFDNMYDEDIIKVVKHNNEKFDKYSLLSMASSQEEYERIIRTERQSATMRSMAGEYAMRKLQGAAKDILDQCLLNSNDPVVATPFAERCIQNGVYYEGGKLDDMTVVLATVTSSLIAEGTRFSADTISVLPAPYKNWLSSPEFRQ